MVTGRGYMDINRISGYIPGKLVQFLMQVNLWVGAGLTVGICRIEKLPSLNPGHGWHLSSGRLSIGIMTRACFDIRFVPQVAGATTSFAFVHQ